MPPLRHRPRYVLSRAPPDALGLGFHVEAAVERAHALLQRRLFTLVLFVVEPLFLDRCRRRGCRRSAGRARPGPELPMAHEALNVSTILGAIADIHGQCARWLDGKARHHNAIWFGPPLNVDRPSGYDRPSRSNALPPRHLVNQELASSRDKSSFASFIFPSMYSLGKVLRAHSVPNSKCDRNGLCICKRSSGVLPHSAASPNITC